MDQTQIDRSKLYREVRTNLVDRLVHMELGFTAQMVEKMSLYAILGLLFTLAGSFNYLPTWTLAVRSLEEILGDQIWQRLVQEPPKVEEPKPVLVN
jgi:hypothetical protein